MHQMCAHTHAHAHALALALALALARAQALVRLLESRKISTLLLKEKLLPLTHSFRLLSD
jgi:hypothetical protein